MPKFEIERCISGNYPYKLYHVTIGDSEPRVFLNAYKAWNYYFTGDPNKYSRRLEDGTKTREANQRLINEAYAHISKTRRKSVDSEGACVYGGIGCAFSPAIRDEFITLCDVLTLVDMFNNFRVYLKPWARDCSLLLAVRVQKCHDNATDNPDLFYGEFLLNLKRLCIDKGYEFPGEI